MLVDRGEALDRAMTLAREICANAPVSVQACLRAVNDIVAAGDDVGWQHTAQALTTAAESADAREGVAAFLQKRPPIWTGH